MARFGVQMGGLRLLAALVVLLPASCGLLRNLRAGSDAGGAAGPEAGAGQEAANQIVGEVVSVHPEGGFVLFKRYGGRSLPTDAVFNTTSRDGRTATIRPTGERSGRFHAADVTGGNPERGDVVMARRLPSGSVEEVVPLPDRQKPGEGPLVPDF